MCSIILFDIFVTVKPLLWVQDYIIYTVISSFQHALPLPFFIFFAKDISAQIGLINESGKNEYCLLKCYKNYIIHEKELYLFEVVYVTFTIQKILLEVEFYF